MKKILVLIILSVLFISSSYSQEMNFNYDIKKSNELDLNHQKKLDLQNKIIHSGKRFSLKDSINSVPQENRENPNKKSPFLGGLFSGVIPGTGQLYAKAYVESAAFFAAEVGLWIAYGIFQKKGNDQTDFFQRYADQNWKMSSYGQWLKDQGFYSSSQINPLETNLEILRAQINICEEDPQNGFSHTLPKPGEQQYYEVIGKYKTYTKGWIEASSLNITRGNWSTYPTIPQVDYYMTERQRANDYFDNGSLMLTVVIINHIISAADGVWSVIRYNNKLDIKTSIDFHSKYSVLLQKSVMIPHFNVCVNF
jgi:hypothetical protein